MPHIVIEYTDNLPDAVDFRRLFAELHSALVATGDVRLEDIKSRAIKLTEWYVGDGDSRHAFVHLKLHLLQGRTAEFKRHALMALRPILVAHFPRSLAERDCQLCFETVEMDGESYLKVVSPQAASA